jgi:hypothetical protein
MADHLAIFSGLFADYCAGHETFRAVLGGAA